MCPEETLQKRSEWAKNVGFKGFSGEFQVKVGPKFFEFYIPSRSCKSGGDQFSGYAVALNLRFEGGGSFGLTTLAPGRGLPAPSHAPRASIATPRFLSPFLPPSLATCSADAATRNNT